MNYRLGVYLLLGGLLPWLLVGWSPSSRTSLAREGWYQVTLYAGTREARTALVRAGWHPDAIDLDRGTVTMVLPRTEVERLSRQGWPLLTVRPLGFPSWDAGYHDYTEMQEVLFSLADRYPDILAVQEYGRSVEGRALYVAKISDRVWEDESASEPGVLIFANIHAREHLSAEQAIWAIRHLVTRYGRDPAVTNLVNQREIWIMPMTNPDGVEYDIARYPYRYWRKNRRPNPDGSYGVDLNRNFGYRWGCCGGSSSTPSAETYRGPAPFSEPETNAIRNFLLDRPNIRIALNFHMYSELVLWPYGYTYDALPPDMDPTDYAVMVRAGRKMAQLSGYRAMQASDLYIADGTSDDWIYGTLRIPTWTVELYPPASAPFGFYPPDEDIPRETERNRGMIEYVIALADEPRRVLGLAGDVISPTVTLTLPPEPPAGGVILASLTISDNVGVTLVAIRAGDTVTRLRSIEPPLREGTLTLPLVLPPGEHTLVAEAYDRAHNVGRSESLRVKVTSQASTWWSPFMNVSTPRR